MAVFQDILSAFKSTIEASAACNAFFKLVVWGDQERAIDSMPALVVDFAEPPITERQFAIGKEKSRAAIFTLRFSVKVKAATSFEAMLESLEGYEITMNALDNQVAINGKIIKFTEINAVGLNNLAADGCIREAVFEIGMDTQPFDYSGR